MTKPAELSASKKLRAHQRYQLPDGTYVPGVTTVLGLRAKPQLIIWANRLGLQGIDSTKYRDEMAEIGSLAHAMILADLKGEKVDTSDYTPNQVDKAENCYLSYLNWAKGKVIEPIAVEESFVCPTWKFGGTPDFYGQIDGMTTLVDYKTGGVYDEAYIQACAYAHLVVEDGSWPPPTRVIVLGIPRAETEKFTEQTYTSTERGFDIFKRLVEIYWLERDGKPLAR